ncbi:MAG: M48 family metalloprotease [Candidatus Tectomicrobia bacterium]|uniref:M48 family metalloprotease n=1 Tax=Tectimicrobiota bacterium TaxID=2528274 RepID=A0A932CR22_UNCTE|nr:M48 family metalloprotease [Candidatus Tectomicrobia bacterium]
MKKRNRISLPTRVAVLLLALLFAAGCATNPVTKKREFVLISEEDEIAIGKEQDPKVLEEFGQFDQAKWQDYVNQVGQKLAAVSHRPELIYRFKVVDSPDLNAFALPGGYIYVTRGLLATLNSEAELATVLGHEIGHVTARHAVEQMTKAQTYQVLSMIGSIFVPQIRQFGQLMDILFFGILMGYGRQAEFQSDQLGIEYAYKAGYDPKAAAGFLKTLKGMEKDAGKGGFEGFFASHPETLDRIKAAEQGAGKWLSGNGQKAPDKLTEGKGTSPGVRDNLIEGRDTYLARLDGLPYGPSPKEGVVTGNVFRHKELGLEVTFPEGWEVLNGKSAVLSKEPDPEQGEKPDHKSERNHFIQMTVDDLSKRYTPEEYARKYAGGKFKIRTGEAREVNGLKAYVGMGEGSHRKLGKIAIQYAFILKGDKVFHLIGFAPPGEFKEVEGKFLKTIESFRGLSREEAEKIKPTRIEIYEVKAGETLEAIVKAHAAKGQDVKEIAKLNGLDPQKPDLKAGQKIKLIVAV